MKFPRSVILSAVACLPLGGASATIILGDFSDHRLVTTESRRPPEFGYHHSVAAVEVAVKPEPEGAGPVIGRAETSRAQPAPVNPDGSKTPPVGSGVERDRAAQAVRLCNRGLLQMQSGKMTEATAAFEKAMKLNPADSRAIMLRGVIDARQGRHDSALDYYNRALEVDPGSVETYQSRGLALMKLERLPQAIEDFTKAVTLNPKFEEGYLRRGLAYGRMGEYSKSVSDNSVAIALNPKNPLSYNNRAAAYRALGEHNKAAADFGNLPEARIRDPGESGTPVTPGAPDQLQWLVERL